MGKKEKDYWKYLRAGQQLNPDRYQQLMNNDFSISFYIAYQNESAEIQEQIKDGDVINFLSPDGKKILAYISRSYIYPEMNQFKHLYYFGIKID